MAAVEAACPSSKFFRFFDLPPELRNRIYHHALVARSAVVILASGLLDSDLNDTEYFHKPLLLSVSRQVRQETTSIFYGCNAFMARWDVDVQTWLHALTAETRMMLREIRLSNSLFPDGTLTDPVKARDALESRI